MRKLMIGAVALFGLAAPAMAAVAVLESVTPDTDGYRFEYRLTLGPDEGLRAGDKLVIYDFAGYVADSIFAPALIAASTEFTSLPFLTPGESDDPGLINLVFTYTGPDFRNVGGPFDSLSALGFGAVSRYRAVTLDAFTSITTKNNPPEAANTILVQGGYTLVPQIPEPATWAMMIVGFGLVGSGLRRRSASQRRVIA